jgi:hypothetical protein
VGDVPQGKTNIVLELEAGVHRVALGPPNDFSPLEQKVRLANTAPMDPCRVVSSESFQRLLRSLRGEPRMGKGIGGNRENCS